jgi:hypothetical protein
MIIFVRDLILSGGKTIVLLGALSSLFLALGYLFAPKLIQGLSSTVNRIFEIDDWLLGHRVFVGTLFLIVAFVLSMTLYFIR